MTTFTLSRHIIEEQRKFPGATGRFSELLAQIAVAAKIVSNEVNKAGLAEILGATGGHNVFGEEVQKLDVFARNMFFSALDHTGLLCVMGSEEDKGIVKIPEEFPIGSYVFLYDPLDGSSNIDVNVSIGTIFSIFNKISDGKRGTLKDCLQPGYKQICSGYVIYGSSTMLVYSTGQGVHGFTLDPAIGEFLLSNYDMKFPPKNKSKKNLSINMGNYNKWDKATQKYVDDLTRNIEKPYRSRYIGSLVADFHRNLLHGGIFLYPGNYKKILKIHKENSDSSTKHPHSHFLQSKQEDEQQQASKTYSKFNQNHFIIKYHLSLDQKMM